MSLEGRNRPLDRLNAPTLTAGYDMNRFRVNLDVGSLAFGA